MEGNQAQPRAILVFGAPCSGKTTFCEKFAKQFKAAYFDLNEVKEKNDLERKHVLLLVEQLAKTGQTLVFEGGIDTEDERKEIYKILRLAHYNPSLIYIQTDVATLRSRLKSKLKSVAKAKAEYEERTRDLEAPSELERPIVLSGKHTYPTQLKQVLTQLA